MEKLFIVNRFNSDKFGFSMTLDYWPEKFTNHAQSRLSLDSRGDSQLINIALLYSEYFGYTSDYREFITDSLDRLLAVLRRLK